MTVHSSGTRWNVARWASERATMKKVVYVDPSQFAAIRLEAMEDEVNGLDPGASWARLYPGATEIEFVVTPNGQAPTQQHCEHHADKA
jgi:hypothetical protein